MKCIGASKATEGFGATLDRPIRSRADLHRLDGQLPAHIATLARTCWALGGRRELAALGLRRWAHMLGYGGHFVTKSRRYSATFTALRAARRAWTIRRHHGPGVHLDQDGRILPPEGMVLVADWRYQGRGYTTYGDAWLAGHLAAPRDAPHRPRGAEQRCLS